jgi:hypothetical protein
MPCVGRICDLLAMPSDIVPYLSGTLETITAISFLRINSPNQQSGENATANEPSFARRATRSDFSKAHH